MWSKNVPFENALHLLEMLSYVATVVGFVVVIVTIFDYKRNIKREHKENEQLLINNSIDVLRAFSEKVIPDMVEADKKYVKEYAEKRKQLLEQLNSSVPDEDRIEELPEDERLNMAVMVSAKNACGYGNIFNKLEQLSVYMNYDIVKQDLVYIPIHKAFLNFLDSNRDYLDKIRSDDAPYVNVLKLDKDWRDKNKIDKLNKIKGDAEKELKKLENQ